ncbi:daunorubicin resistance ABC transporter membrane protein [Candidatus Methanoperedens nitroreducens]|uniref:Daunorubicin resistance ABC transporter membrane protein n=1 Tax=Candidatus Methanoperedens nitratireducens TaxID=1392998 RepID=A0A062V6A0_9EURY|nr:ABC transporter permease [Candidatus Methanoperedens nitroreducens]KCZ71314.1 daunorubicin resistance ABC transporter membrane protein [Candidatus Methanoperedens nitroreducens]MDJ1420940.1 ABC transporter permease [Candidatus Methanoperedens sp.]
MVKKAINTVYTMWLREMLRFWRSKSRIVGSLATPLFFLIILGAGFSSSFQLQGGGTFDRSYLAPGLIGMSVLFSSVMGGVSIIWDREFGFLKEILIAPVSRFFVSLGKAVGGVTTSMIQGILIMIIAWLIGIRYVSFPGVLASIAVMFVLGIGFIGLGISLASRIESHEGFQMVMSFLTLPLVLLSGAFFPISNLPGWLIMLVYANPLTYGVEALRWFLLGNSIIPVSLSIIVIVSFALSMTVLGGKLFGKMKV